MSPPSDVSPFPSPLYVPAPFPIWCGVFVTGFPTCTLYVHGSGGPRTRTGDLISVITVASSPPHSPIDFAMKKKSATCRPPCRPSLPHPSFHTAVRVRPIPAKPEKIAPSRRPIHSARRPIKGIDEKLRSVVVVAFCRRFEGSLLSHFGLNIAESVCIICPTSNQSSPPRSPVPPSFFPPSPRCPSLFQR